MAVTAAALATALGIAVADPDNADDPGLIESARLRSIAVSLVDAYLRSADHECPADVYDEAVIRTAGHVTQRQGFGRVEGRIKIGNASQIDLQPAARSAVRQSGAGALLSPWVVRTA